jgi:hypothetical protein
MLPLARQLILALTWTPDRRRKRPLRHRLAANDAERPAVLLRRRSLPGIQGIDSAENGANRTAQYWGCQFDHAIEQLRVLSYTRDDRPIGERHGPILRGGAVWKFASGSVASVSLVVGQQPVFRLLACLLRKILRYKAIEVIWVVVRI